MPIFEYKCLDCGKVSEFLQAANDKFDGRCEQCGGSRLRKQFSVFNPGAKPGNSKRCLGCTDESCPHTAD